MKILNSEINPAEVKFRFDMQMAGFRKKTITAYEQYVRQMSVNLQKAPEIFDCADVLTYLKILFDKGCVGSTVRGAYCALKFYLTKTKGMEWTIKEMPRMPKYRKQRARPLTRTEIKSVLENTCGSRYRLMFSVIYGSGLRISEACALKVSDLDFKNSKLYIRNTKGGRHRESVLSKNVALELKEYIASRRPGLWLFPSVRNEYETDLLFPEQKDGKPISARSVQREFWLTKNKLGISGTVSIHSLRHSFATHLIEYGMSLFSLQRLLGHQNVGTTIGYLQSIEFPVMPDFSPLDRLT